MDNAITFGTWLRQRRKERGITYDELAEQIGCSRITLIKLEAGERRPSRQIADLLAQQFLIPSDEREAFTTFARTGQAVTSSEAVSGELAMRAPWRTAHLHQTNLPTLLTSLIGRERDIEATCELLMQSKVRLLTFTGAPGIGKTRLATQVASNLVDHFEDGVFFVDLAPISDPGLVLPTIASALGLKQEIGRRIEAVLLEHVRGKRMLLALDNFEQVLDAAQQVVKIMEASPWLKMLVTSREALHVRGERRYPVPPLGTPDPKQLPPVEALASYPSVELFVQRAQAVAPDFALTQANAEDVAVVCVGLEGLPLAIELAAARARHLSPRDMRTGVQSRLRLLTGGARDLPIRHRTLMGAIEWSYNLLGADEQALFRGLGVFVGGFTAHAVQAIANDPSAPSSLRSEGIVSVLLSLVDKNLVKQESLGGIGGLARYDPAGERRFVLLETLREFALDRLAESGESDVARWQHAGYYLALAEEVMPRLPSADAKALMDQLEREHDNFRAALGWLLEFGGTTGKALDTGGLTNIERVEAALKLCIALWAFWIHHGHISEGRKWFEAAYAKLVELLGPTAAAGVPNSLPTASTYSGSLPVLWAKALSGIGLMAQFQADYDTAVSFHERSLDMRRELGDKEGISSSLFNLGNIATFQGRYEVARSYHQEALGLARELDQNPRITTSLMSLGQVECAVGNNVEALALFEEALTLTYASGDDRAKGAALDGLGVVAYRMDDYALARRYYEEALHRLKEHGDKHSAAVTLVHFGILSRDEGRYGQALRQCREALLLLRELGDRLVIAQCLEGIASILAIANQPEKAEGLMAARLYGAASALREALHCPVWPPERPQYERYLASAREQLHKAAWEVAWAEGRAMSIEAAIDYAFEGPSDM